MVKSRSAKRNAKNGRGLGRDSHHPLSQVARYDETREIYCHVDSDLQALIDVARFNPEITEPMAVSYVVGICKDHHFDGGSF